MNCELFDAKINNQHAITFIKIQYFLLTWEQITYVIRS